MAKTALRRMNFPRGSPADERREVLDELAFAIKSEPTVGTLAFMTISSLSRQEL
jgi:hypothetical protein